MALYKHGVWLDPYVLFFCCFVVDVVCMRSMYVSIESRTNRSKQLEIKHTGSSHSAARLCQPLFWLSKFVLAVSASGLVICDFCSYRLELATAGPGEDADDVVAGTPPVASFALARLFVADRVEPSVFGRRVLRVVEDLPH